MRHCLLSILTFLIVANGYAQNPGWFVLSKNQNSQIVDIAQTQIGITELTGKNDGFDVEKYLATTGLGGGYAWCAAFVNWVYLQAGVKVPDSKAAWSPTWFPPEKTYWQLGVSEYLEPMPGDVFGIYFKSKNRIAHVGIIQQWKGHYASTIEGNTNDAGSREGDGVWRKKRMKRQVSKVSRWER